MERSWWHCRTPLAAAIRRMSLVAVLAAPPIAGPPLAAGMSGGAAALDPDPRLAQQPSWSVPAATDVRHAALEWFAARRGADIDISAAAEENVRNVWERALTPGSGVDPLDAVMTTITAVDARAAELRAAIDAGTPAAAWLDEPTTATFERDSVKLWLGRELVRRDRFDEALPWLAGLDVATAVDPASLLFHRAACQHWLLDTEAAMESLAKLLERESEIPVRYARVARLLQADLEKLRADSLDHIARRMKDLTRRLDQGRAGPATRQVQVGVVESLDKLIEKIEQQQQQQQQQAGAGSGNAGGPGGSAAKPQDESRPGGGRGPGDVQHRDLGSGEGWGKLPPHERERVLQQIGREFPPHYREAIEHYFRRLATGEEDR